MRTWLQGGHSEQQTHPLLSPGMSLRNRCCPALPDSREAQGRTRLGPPRPSRAVLRLTPAHKGLRYKPHAGRGGTEQTAAPAPPPRHSHSGGPFLTAGLSPSCVLLWPGLPESQSSPRKPSRIHAHCQKRAAGPRAAHKPACSCPWGALEGRWGLTRQAPAWAPAPLAPRSEECYLVESCKL